MQFQFVANELWPKCGTIDWWNYTDLLYVLIKDGVIKVCDENW